jgi:2-polyprenyl-3-methyl-5-hydroxy-6-metoxy-1,4-benzoquinol methylase
MLHYGYFENTEIETESISLSAIENAQIKYAQNIIDQISAPEDLILDIGCGMGGLSNMISQKGFMVDALTPNEYQIKYIQSKYPHIRCYHGKFQNFIAEKMYGTIINSESLQYIPLKKAFDKAEMIVKSGGIWIIADYFRISDSGINKSSHLLEHFIQKTKEYDWEIVHQRDITPNVLPTIKFVYDYAERFMLPLVHFASEKLRCKKAWIYYAVKDVKQFIDQKISKEMASIDPVKFKNEKKYMFFVLRKKHGYPAGETATVF